MLSGFSFGDDDPINEITAMYASHKIWVDEVARDMNVHRVCSSARAIAGVLARYSGKTSAA